MRFDRSNYMQDDNLAKSDRATMLASIEARVPLLDHRVVEFAASLPDSHLISDGRTKFVLRELARKYVPAALLERPKMGFSVPIDAWLRGPLREWAGESLRKGGARGIMGGSKGINLIEQGYFDGQSITPWQMWALVTLCAWLE
jgi:asparagine synthase (glutamine-hydrolysing)